MTSVDSADPVNNHKDIAEIDMASNCEDTALREGQSPHDEADMTSVNSADPVTNRKDTALRCSQSPHDEADITGVNSANPVTNRKDTADIDMASNREGTALQGGLNPGYEGDMAKESVPRTADDQKQFYGTVLTQWPFTCPKEVDSSAFTTDEYDRLEDVTKGIEYRSFDTLSDLVGALGGQIGLYPVFCTAIPWDKLAVDAQHELKALGNNIKRYANSMHQYHQGIIFETLTWHILINNLFSPDCTEKWHGEAWQSFGTMQAHFQERLKDSSSDYASWFYSWKSESARMAYALNGNSSNPKRIKNILMEQLGRFMTISPQASEVLDRVAGKAIEIEVRIQTSPWCYKLDMHHPDTLERSGFAYTKFLDRMEAVDPDRPPSRGAPIDIICAPSLREYGIATYSFTHGFVVKYSNFDKWARSRALKVHALGNVIC
ncbi:hypothetical protein EDB80DRAFT_878493 [Ilyonectria destructans]|nr:hypothetical protein EDB80DRAFT_878493 [Ilyonectria destructans]